MDKQDYKMAGLVCLVGIVMLIMVTMITQLEHNHKMERMQLEHQFYMEKK